MNSISPAMSRAAVATACALLAACGDAPAPTAAPKAVFVTSVTPAAFAQFDVAGSYRPCEGN